MMSEFETKLGANNSSLFQRCSSVQGRFCWPRIGSWVGLIERPHRALYGDPACSCGNAKLCDVERALLAGLRNPCFTVRLCSRFITNPSGCFWVSKYINKIFRLPRSYRLLSNNHRIIFGKGHASPFRPTLRRLGRGAWLLGGAQTLLQRILPCCKRAH